jgi:hypothetical protein
MFHGCLRWIRLLVLIVSPALFPPTIPKQLTAAISLCNSLAEAERGFNLERSRTDTYTQRRVVYR